MRIDNYFDFAATSVNKPKCVAEAVCEALERSGNPGRGVHDPALFAAETVYVARERIATLLGAGDPARIAFAMNATQALNTAIKGLIRPGDHVITTVLEHNSVLRPLYEMREQGVSLTIAGCDAWGNPNYDQVDEAATEETRAIVCTHASNLTGNVVDLARMREIADRCGCLLIVDASQTAGALPIDVESSDIDVLCFTGHKSLLGPQGTGGLYVREGLQVRPLLSGGSGFASFSEKHPEIMPEALEAGTLNVHGIAGLSAAADYLLQKGIDAIHREEEHLTQLFYEEVRGIPDIRVYGDHRHGAERAPIISLNLGDADSSYVSDLLFMEYGICTRPGAHCAPLMHRALGTEEQGAVRFSFSFLNTEEEILRAARALHEIAE